MILVYKTVENARAGRKKSINYRKLKKIVGEYAGKRVVLLVDMNAHFGMLGEQVNRNGEMLAEFIDEMI